MLMGNLTLCSVAGLFMAMGGRLHGDQLVVNDLAVLSNLGEEWIKRGTVAAPDRPKLPFATPSTSPRLAGSHPVQTKATDENQEKVAGYCLRIPH
jgi:hypothetical protein